MDILIVEDDFISRNILKKMLVEMGHTVIEAEDGEKAWEILKSKKAKIVISDWMMPGLNGLELCKRIRTEFSKEYVYVINCQCAQICRFGILPGCFPELL